MLASNTVAITNATNSHHMTAPVRACAAGQPEQGGRRSYNSNLAAEKNRNTGRALRFRDVGTDCRALPQLAASASSLPRLGPFLLELRSALRVESKLPVPTPPMPYREKTPTGLATLCSVEFTR
jgi:hypothetical protein